MFVVGAAVEEEDEVKAWRESEGDASSEGVINDIGGRTWSVNKYTRMVNNCNN